MTKTYLIHDNGGRPFKVVINDNVSVYNENGYNEQTDEIIYSKEPIIDLKGISNIFIGKSPENEMTKFSGGYGPNFDGNSILVHIKDNEYIYIGSEIFRFHSFAEIIDYKSPVGNSDVSYPYAIDKENNYYLMIEDVVINKNSNILILFSLSQYLILIDPFALFNLLSSLRIKELPSIHVPLLSA